MRRAAVEAVIEWAVAPLPPLPAVCDTEAATAFWNSLAHGPAIQRLAVRALLTGPGRVIARRRASPVAEALAALAQLAYYGEPAVLEALGCPPSS